jgi:hypothetical protein
MNTIRRDGADDTGNQDVRGLRRHFLGGNGASQEMPKEANTPHLRDKEDVPHEGSIPDFYGLADPFEDTAEGQIEAVLLKMVDEGELCFGWIEERQEMGFWRCDDAESCCPTPEPTPEPETKRVSHRRAPTTRQRVMSRAMVTMVAAVATPFAIGVGAYAVDQAREQHKPTVERTDLTAEESPSQTPAPVAAPTVMAAPAAPATLPTVNPNSARGGIPGGKHRKEPEHPQPEHAPEHDHKHGHKDGHKHHHHLAGEHKGHHHIGKHRRDNASPAPTTALVTAAPRPPVNEGRRNTQGGLVSEVISPVEALLGRTFR